MTVFESLSGTNGDFIVALLGGFALFWGGSVLGIPMVSQRLLAFLALHGRMVKRAAVAGTLWPDASERHAYSNLRSALARLQARLARRWRQALSSAWPRASRLTSATPKRSPGGCLIRQLRPIGPS
jgi:two-component SAPR family response regulator